MKIYLKNQSDKRLIITLNGIVHFLPSKDSEIYEAEENVRLVLTTDDEYSYETFSEKRGMTVFHRFITQATYDFVLEKDAQLILETEIAKGNNLESYQRVVAKTIDFTLPKAVYSVKNEKEVKEKLSCDEKKLDDFDKKTKSLGKALTVADKLDDIFTVICCVFLALVFIAIIVLGLITFTVPTIIILIVLLLLGVITYRSIKKLIPFVSKTFEKLLDRHGDKVFPCPDMPDGLYKDSDSYFSGEYIDAVFKYSTKRK